MLNFFKKNKKNNETGKNIKEVIFKIDGMHCTSCSMSVDGEMEELDGVFSSHTKYAKSTSKVKYDPSKVGLSALEKVITDLGYQVK